MFRAPDEPDAPCDPQIPLDAKHMFGVMCLDTVFVESITVPLEHEK
jgi:hypothetical protein